MSEKWKEVLRNDPVPWLLSSVPWAKYKTLTDLVETENLDAIHAAKKELLGDPQILNLVYETNDWMPKSAKRNNDPKISYFKLRMLSDFGLCASDDVFNAIIEKTVAHEIDNMFAVRGYLPERPKKGEKYVEPDLYADHWHVSPCNSPTITVCMLGIKYKNAQVNRAVEELKKRWDTKEGWFCHFFFVESQFKKLKIGCPMAALIALDVFSCIEELKESLYAKNAFEVLKFHKEYGKSIYYFGRSKKFWTLKYPFVWYNALYLAEVLSRYKIFKEEELVKDLISWIESMQSENGRFKPTSIYMNYKNWEFSNKKEESPWITFLCCRILKRWYS